jgi:lipoate-protein ligase A
LQVTDGSIGPPYDAEVRLIDASHPDDPVLDLAVTHALLREVAAGEAPPTARVFRPGPTLAFGRVDALQPGFAAAAAAARHHAFTPLVRLGGGRAAAYDRGSVLLELVVPTDAIVDGIERRFADATTVVVTALTDLGLGPEVGALPGEYCPGRFSVHAGGVKLAGLAQRSIRGASLVSAMVVVEHGAAIRALLTDVYAALGVAWDPRTAGAAADVAAGLRVAGVQAAIVAALEATTVLEPASLGAGTLERAGRLASGHAVPLP